MEELKFSDAGNSAVSDSKEATASTLNEFWHIFTYSDTLDRALFAVAFVASIATGVAMPLMTIVFGRFTTTFADFSTGAVSGPEFRSNVNGFVLYFIYLFVGKMVLGYVSALAVTIAGMRTTRAIRKAFFSHLLRMDIGHFDLPQSGSPATQVTTSTNRINQGVSDKLATMVQSLAGFFSSCIIALVIQWKLSLIVLSAIPAILLTMTFCLWVDAKQEVAVTKLYSQASIVALEAISTIRTVQAFCAQTKLVRIYNKLMENAQKEGNKKSINYGIMMSSEYFLIYSAMALAFWQGHRMFLAGQIANVGTVFTVVLSLMIASSSLGALLPHLTTVTNAAAAASELFSIMRKESLVDPLDESGIKPDSCIGDIQFSNVNFAYPSRLSKQVLSDFSISIPAGKTTALVGASGSGKSTLIGLLEKWYLPESGSIVLDGNELRDINTRWVRSHVRLVQQEPVLFQGTIFENIALGFVDGQKDLPYKEQLTLVEEACKSSNAHGFILQLPEGYQTQVGERAGTLSGGQKQRIIIARSILSNPKVLLLDEATSALDPNSERIVQGALNEVSKDRTTVTVAHRLSTIKSADNIVVMGSGRVIEQGSHAELIALNGQYANLVRAQQLGDAPNSALDDDATSGSEPDEILTLAKTTSAPASRPQDETVDHGRHESLGYSLLRCLGKAMSEQTDLYPWVAVCILAAIIAAGTFPAQAILFSRVIDSFTGAPGLHSMNFWALMFFVVALGNLVAYFILGFCCNQIAQAITRRYRQEMFQRVLSLDISFFDLPHNTSGALASKLSSIPVTLQDLMSFNMVVLLILLLNIIFCAGIALGHGWKLALVTIFGGMTVIVFAGYIRIRVETKLDEDNAARFSESAGVASDAVGAIRTVASLTIEPEFLKKYDNMLSAIVMDSAKLLSITMLPYSIAQSLDFLVMALGFWYGARLLSTGEYNTNQFFVIFLGVLFSSQAAAQFFGYTSSFTKAQGAANYFFWLRSIQPTIRETGPNNSVGPDGDADLEFKAVQFAYPQRPSLKVLKGITFQVKAGKSVAFVGPSGCGKSTMISLIERFYDPISGSIKFGGNDITTMSPMRYRGAISLVQQEPVLYQGSVRDNITLGLETEPSQAEIEAACSQANALDFIVSLPEGFNTPCGSRGMSFSGGQRQRIAIARALIRSPQLLLLDEATSALDAQSEKVVQEALAEASSAAGRTTVAVAHRLATIRNYDTILVFENGRIVEMGNHDELRASGGRYHQMCLAQALDG